MSQATLESTTAPTGEPDRTPAPRSEAEWRTPGWLYVVLTVGLFLVVVPFIWMLVSSFKPEAEVRMVPPTWWPETVTTENYDRLFTQLDFPTYFMNSAIVALAVTAGNMIFCTMLGYALAKLDFPGKKVLFAIVLGMALINTAVPVVFLLVGTFMKLFGFFNIPEPYTTSHWQQVLGDPLFLTALTNTLKLAGFTALIAVALYTLVGYIIMRTRFVGRGVLDFVTWLPSTLPGIILGLGLLALFLSFPPLRLFFGGPTAGILRQSVVTVRESTELEVDMPELISPRRSSQHGRANVQQPRTGSGTWPASGLHSR